MTQQPKTHDDGPPPDTTTTAEVSPRELREAFDAIGAQLRRMEKAIRLLSTHISNDGTGINDTIHDVLSEV